MKVYVVTTGSYSDYEIAKIFLDKNKAEEFANWVKDSNGVDEWETSDDDFEFGGLKDKVIVSAHYYPNTHYININKTEYYFGDMVNRFPYTVYKNKEYTHLCTYKIVPNDYDEEKIKRILYDKWAEVQSLCAEGFTVEQINEMINR